MLIRPWRAEFSCVTIGQVIATLIHQRLPLINVGIWQQRYAALLESGLFPSEAR